MFEDEAGLYLEHLKSGKVYSIMVQELNVGAGVNEAAKFGQRIKELQAENESLKERIEKLERSMQRYQLRRVKELQE